MTADFVEADLSEVRLVGHCNWGYSCTLLLVPHHVVFSTLSADNDDNIIPFHARIEVLRGLRVDNFFHIESSTQDSLLVSELRHFETSIDSLRHARSVKATMRTLEGRCQLAIRTIPSSLAGLLEVDVEFLLPTINREEPLLQEYGWQGRIHLQFIEGNRSWTYGLKQHIQVRNP